LHDSSQERNRIFYRRPRQSRQFENDNPLRLIAAGNDGLTREFIGSSG
jgi:hypothetical protein